MRLQIAGQPAVLALAAMPGAQVEQVQAPEGATVRMGQAAAEAAVVQRRLRVVLVVMGDLAPNGMQATVLEGAAGGAAAMVAAAFVALVVMAASTAAEAAEGDGATEMVVTAR